MNAENIAKNKGRGRPKGSLNKVGKAAKDAIAEAAAALGGPNRLVAWAKEDPANERAFWTTIYPKIVPLSVGGDSAPINHHHTVEWVNASSASGQT